MIATLKKARDKAMAQISQDGGYRVPDWFLRGVVAVILVAVLIGIGNAAVQDHKKVWEHETKLSTQADEIKDLKDQTKAISDVKTDIAVTRQDVANIKEQQKIMLQILQGQKGRRDDR